LENEGIMSDCSIHQADAVDFRYLNNIELAAAKMFPVGSIPDNIRNEALPFEVLESAQREGRLWVAADANEKPVGFIVVRRNGDKAFVVELDVHPDHHRKGIGRALIKAAVAWAQEQRCKALTLTTFSGIPWNGPYYERLGFRRLDADELDESLVAQLKEEEQRGLKDRVAMRIDLNIRIESSSSNQHVL
jgi:GNAT superfamily N-acetyltransferase